MTSVSEYDMRSFFDRVVEAVTGTSSELHRQTDRAVIAEADLARTATELEQCRHGNEQLAAEVSDITGNRDWWREQSNKFEADYRQSSNEAEGLRYQVQQLQTELEQVKQARDAANAKVEAIQSAFRGLAT